MKSFILPNDFIYSEENYLSSDEIIWNKMESYNL